MAAHNLTTPRTARYFSLENGPAPTQHWIALHGYGQLAEYFIKHFVDLPNAKIIAPEGLSRFYLDGLGGRVGASWMTAVDREVEITDQTEFLNRLQADAVPQGELPVVLGFSQGATCAARWVLRQRVPVKALVLWAGNFPHDVDATLMADHLKNMPVHFVIGTRDPFIKAADVAAKIEPLKAIVPHLQVHWFDGEHTMHGPTLAHIAQSL